MPKGDRFVEVPAASIFAFLEARGFVRSSTAQGREVCYDRSHDKVPAYTVRVYTSVAIGCERARKLGGDAIRVCAFYTNPSGKTFGVAKSARVFRTGTVDGVLARLLERMREAYAVVNEDIKRQQQRRAS